MNCEFFPVLKCVKEAKSVSSAIWFAALMIVGISSLSHAGTIAIDDTLPTRESPIVAFKVATIADSLATKNNSTRGPAADSLASGALLVPGVLPATSPAANFAGYSSAASEDCLITHDRPLAATLGAVSTSPASLSVNDLTSVHAGGSIFVNADQASFGSSPRQATLAANMSRKVK